MAISHKYGKVYNWLPDRPDQRDKQYCEHLKVGAPTPTPASVSLLKQCPPVFDQGNLGSCTGNAISGMFGFVQLKELAKPGQSPEEFSSTYEAASRLFIYYGERALEGSIPYDAGAMIRDGIKVLNKTGVCREKLWPYDVNKFAMKPSAECFAEAAKHKISSYYRLNTLDDMIHCLAAGYPFVFGFTVYESFESDEVARTGEVPMPEQGEQVLGGHAVMAIGYNKHYSRFLVRNSWGTGWGLQGNFHIPMAYLDPKNQMSDDFWTMRY